MKIIIVKLISFNKINKFEFLEELYHNTEILGAFPYLFKRQLIIEPILL